MILPRISIGKLPKSALLFRDIFGYFFPGSIAFVCLLSFSGRTTALLQDFPLGNWVAVGIGVIVSYILGYALHTAGRFVAAIFVGTFIAFDILFRKTALRTLGSDFSFFATPDETVATLNDIIVTKLGGLLEPTDLYYRLRYVDFSPTYSDRLAILERYYVSKYGDLFEEAARAHTHALMTITMGTTFLLISFLFPEGRWLVLALAIVLLLMGGAYSLQDSRFTIPAIIAARMLEQAEAHQASPRSTTP